MEGGGKRGGSGGRRAVLVRWKRVSVVMAESRFGSEVVPFFYCGIFWSHA